MDPRTTSSIFTRGAVDLGALRDRNAASERAGEARPAEPTSPAARPTGPGAGPGGSPGAGPGGSPGAGPGGGPGPGGSAGAGPGAAPGSHAGGVTIIDVTEATFQTEVLERSLTTPVIIDFWADWCGPCKQLSPVLEKLAIEGNGAWVLAKIDVDANQRIAQAFRVQGIPMVFAVVGGQPIDAFTGVVPESQLRPWIEAVLKTAGQEVEIPPDPALLAADDAMAEGDLDDAERAYKKILAEHPADQAAQAGLAQVGLLRRIEGVEPGPALVAADAAPTDLDAQFLAADLEVVTGAADKAYGRLVDLVRRSAADDRDKAREHLVTLFAIAAPDDPAVIAARRALANALF